MRRLLVISCSERKIAGDVPLPAMERYDGPAFRVLRKYLSAVKDKGLTVRIVSAEYGLIRADKMIPHYDRCMDAMRAAELHPAVSVAVSRAMEELRPAATLLCMSRLYLSCAGEISKAEVAAPGQGRKLAHLKNWLYSH